MQPAPALDPSPQHEPLDGRLFAIVGVILAFLGALFVAGLWVQESTYRKGMDKALAEAVPDHGAILSYARGLDAAIVKTSALFLGFLLVFTGALYVLRIATVQYRLAVTSGTQTGNLETSSPGLVIITLGIVLIIVTLLTHNSLDYKPPFDQSGSPVSDQPLPVKEPPQ